MSGFIQFISTDILGRDQTLFVRRRRLHMYFTSSYGKFNRIFKEFHQYF